MPSERYYKLSEDKQERIMDASLDEFTREGFESASINQIIKEADISRGSFYTYFEDKHDLFRFIFDKLKASAAKEIVKEVVKDDGDIFAACRNLMKVGLRIRGSAGDKILNFYDKIMSDMGILTHIGDKEKNTEAEKENIASIKKMIYDIYANMNDLKEHISLEDFYGIADMLITISVKTLVTVKQRPELLESEMNKLFYQYEIIENGIRGGNKQ